MENLYNAVVSFKGDNGFTFYLPKYGELTIYNGKNIFIKGLTTSGVETLRELRPLLLEHKLNGKPDGCYKVIDLTQISDGITPKKVEKPEPVKSVADLKAEMIKTEGPIEEPEINSGDISTEESKVEIPEEPKKEVVEAEKPKTNKKTTTKKGGKRGKLGKK